MPAETSKLSSHFNVILIIMANSLKNGLLITTQKDARCTSPKPHWNEESGRFLLLTKSTCLRLHQRNCGLLHVSLLPSQCLQQLDVMWILQMESTLAQMVLPDCKHKQWNAFRGLSGEPLLWFKCSVYQCVKLSKHANVVPKVLPPALEQTPTSAHYAIFPMISTEQSRPLPA